MASDEAYGAFLDKANEDPNPPSAKSASSTSKGKKSGVKSVDAEVPPALQEADGQHFYVSDADEPFVPVSLKWNGEETIDDGESLASFDPHLDLVLSLCFVRFVVGPSSASAPSSSSIFRVFVFPGRTTERGEGPLYLHEAVVLWPTAKGNW